MADLQKELEDLEKDEFVDEYRESIDKWQKDIMRALAKDPDAVTRILAMMIVAAEAERQ